MLTDAERSVPGLGCFANISKRNLKLPEKHQGPRRGQTARGGAALRTHTSCFRAQQLRRAVGAGLRGHGQRPGLSPEVTTAAATVPARPGLACSGRRLQLGCSGRRQWGLGHHGRRPLCPGRHLAQRSDRSSAREDRGVRPPLLVPSLAFQKTYRLTPTEGHVCGT